MGFRKLPAVRELQASALQLSAADPPDVLSKQHARFHAEAIPPLRGLVGQNLCLRRSHIRNGELLRNGISRRCCCAHTGFAFHRHFQIGRTGHIMVRLLIHQKTGRIAIAGGSKIGQQTFSLRLQHDAASVLMEMARVGISFRVDKKLRKASPPGQQPGLRQRNFLHLRPVMRMGIDLFLIIQVKQHIEGGIRLRRFSSRETGDEIIVSLREVAYKRHEYQKQCGNLFAAAVDRNPFSCTVVYRHERLHIAACSAERFRNHILPAPVLIFCIGMPQ